MAQPRDCRTCGTHITTPIANQQYCSPECRPAFRRDPARQLRRHEIDPGHEYTRQRTWRRYVAEACGYRCVDCGEEGAEHHAHHVIPRSAGGKNTVKNGVLLCPSCHKARHNGASSEDDLVERIATRVVEKLREKSRVAPSLHPLRELGPPEYFSAPKARPHQGWPPSRTN